MSNLLKLILFIAVVAIAEGRTVSVSVGSFGNYTTIQEAYNDVYAMVMNDTDYTEINIELADDEIFSGQGNVNLNFTSFLKNRLVIRSVSQTTIDCQNTSRFLFINNPALNPNQTYVTFIDITLDGLILTNCNANNSTNYTSGGAIYIASNYTQVTIQNSVFRGNYAVRNGGAVYLLGPNTMTDNYTIPLALFLSNVTFYNNTALNAGGAILLSNGNFTVTNTEFTNNTASQGGAVYANNCDSDSQFNNVKFSLNTATDAGAALYAVTASSICIGCVFTNNTGRSSGAVYLNMAVLTSRNSQFMYNFANGQGSVLSAQNGGLNAVNSYFYQNYAGLYGTVSASSSTIRLNGSIFESNTAGTGGAVYALSDSRVFINSCKFTQNSAYYGGVLYVQYNVKVVITDTEISDNNAIEDGGAIYCSGSTLSINNANFTSNTAPTDEDIHCGTEVPGTYCAISGDTEYANKCGKPTIASGLTDGSKAIIGLVVGILGGALVIWTVAFFVYFSKRENRKSQGMYLSLLGDYENKNEDKKASHVEMAVRDSDSD